MSLEEAQIPKALAAPVFVSKPTKPPNKAQNKKIRMFHPSAKELATKSVRVINAVPGLPPATIRAPDKIPKKRDTITSFVMNAKTMVRRGGIIPHNPKCSIKKTSRFSIKVTHSTI